MDGEGSLSIEWTAEDIMPQQLVDILVSTVADNEHGDTELPCLNDQSEDETETDDEVENIIDVIFDDDQDD